MGILIQPPVELWTADLNYPHRCDCGCGIPLIGANRYHALSFVKGGRVNMVLGRAFASRACRTRWWIDSSNDGMFPISHPSSSPTIRHCHHCSPLIGFDKDGPVFGDTVSVAAGHQVKADPSKCNYCSGSRTLKFQPNLWCSHDEAHQNYGHEWDKDLRVIVIDHDGPVDDPVTIHHSDTISGVPPHLINEMWRFDCPHDLNEWWNSGLTLNEHISTRMRFELMKNGDRVHKSATKKMSDAVHRFGKFMMMGVSSINNKAMSGDR